MREAKAQAAKRQTNNYEGQSLSESKEIKAREPRVHMCTNLVPRPSLPPTACICILQVTKNWRRGSLGTRLHPYHMLMYLVPKPGYEATRTSYPPELLQSCTHMGIHYCIHYCMQSRQTQLATITLFDNSTCT